MKKSDIFVPEIWSKKIVEKWYFNTILDNLIRDFQLTSSEIIKLCAARIEELKSKGKLDEEIEQNLKTYTEELLKMGSEKGFESNLNTATVAIKVIPDITFGIKIQTIPFTKILAGSGI